MCPRARVLAGLATWLQLTPSTLSVASSSLGPTFWLSGLATS